MSAEERRVPIFELTNFDTLLDWTLAIDRFLGTGDARPACNLATREVTPLLATSKGRHEAASLIRKLTATLEKFTKVLTTCRGLELSTVAFELKNTVSQCEKIDLIKPLKPLLSKIKEQMHDFTNDEIHNGIQAVKWCFKHNLIQQGYTILREILLTHFNLGAGQDPHNKDNREIAGQALTIHREGMPEKEWISPASEYKETTRKFLIYFSDHSELIKTYNDLAALRNDLNHAGYKTNPADPYKFERRLKEFIEQVEQSLR